MGTLAGSSVFKLFLLLILLSSHSAVAPKGGGGGFSPRGRFLSNCKGKTICDFIVDGFEFSEEKNGQTVCLFGITDIGHINTTKFCKTSCNKDRHYNCTCVSEELSEEALRIEGEKWKGYSYIILETALALCLAAGIIFLGQFIRQVINNSHEVLDVMMVVDENDSDRLMMKETSEVAKTNPEVLSKTLHGRKRWFGYPAEVVNEAADYQSSGCFIICGLIIVFALILFSPFYARGAAIIRDDFWRGC